MNFLTVMFLLTFLMTDLFIMDAILFYKNTDHGWVIWMLLSITMGVFCIVSAVAAIIQPFSLQEEALRQAKEREQILYQKSILTYGSDRVKLNEWILTYNDWVNDINTNKEMYGWFSWYYNFDMSGHKIIDLV